MMAFDLRAICCQSGVFIEYYPVEQLFRKKLILSTSQYEVNQLFKEI